MRLYLFAEYIHKSTLIHQVYRRCTKCLSLWSFLSRIRITLQESQSRKETRKTLHLGCAKINNGMNNNVFGLPMLLLQRLIISFLRVHQAFYAFKVARSVFSMHRSPHSEKSTGPGPQTFMYAKRKNSALQGSP